VVAAISIGGGSIEDFAALLAAPFYILWKLTMSPLIIKMARQNIPWIRTQR
jgi:hypothetical protein